MKFVNGSDTTFTVGPPEPVLIAAGETVSAWPVVKTVGGRVAEVVHYSSDFGGMVRLQRNEQSGVLVLKDYKPGIIG